MLVETKVYVSRWNILLFSYSVSYTELTFNKCTSFSGKHDPISLSREAEYPLNGALPDPGISGFDFITMPEHTTDSYRRGRQNSAFVTSNGSVYPHVYPGGLNSNGTQYISNGGLAGSHQSSGFPHQNGYHIAAQSDVSGSTHHAEVHVNGAGALHVDISSARAAVTGVDLLETPSVPNTSQGYVLLSYSTQS